MKLHLVPARTGVEWVRLGLRTFWRQPLAFVSLFFALMALISIVAQVPFIGGMLPFVFVPVLTLGMMVAASVASSDETPKPVGPAMFAAAVRALRARWRPMLVLGLISAAYFVLIVVASALIDGGDVAGAYLFNKTVTREVVAGSNFQLAQLFVMCLNLPLSLAMWHAPGLVHWHGVAPVKSLFFSLVALFRNFSAYAMFLLAWFGVFMVCGLVLALVATMLVGVGALALGDAASVLGGALMIACALALAAMPLSSTWFSFRDSFDAEDA
jgi:hypothetical protein